MPKVKIKKKKRDNLYKRLRKFADRFSAIEVQHILIAWLVLSLAFTYVLDSGINGIVFLLVFTASLIVLGCGFIMHELMHKFTAQKYRYRAEFRIWTWGIFLALITSLFGFIFAAPGATYFEPDPHEQYLDPKGFIQRYGTISLAGPKVNLIFGFLFIALFFLIEFAFPSVTGVLASFAVLVTGLGAYINFYLAAFNLLPINPLDGYKVFRWSKPHWVAYFVAAVAMTAVNFIYVLPHIQIVF
jgi:Zn-dependent protease